MPSASLNLLRWGYSGDPRNPQDRDPEVRELAAYAEMIRSDYQPDEADPWQDSPFAWIRSRQSRQRGAIGEKLVAAWCAAKGFDVARTGDPEADRLIEGYRFEIKFSTLWKTGVYKFQQIRDQDYDYLFALGISPYDAHAWVIPKSILEEKVIGRMGQHTGADAIDTAWLSVTVGNVYAWMKPYGGSLAAVRDILTRLGTGSSP